MKSYELSALVEKILSSKKYRHLAPATIEDVLKKEFAHHKTPKQAFPFAKQRLHRILADYLGEADLAEAQASLKQAFATQQAEAIREVCQQILTQHVSSRERIPILSEIYRVLIEKTGTPQRILDLACAYNPLTYPWMDLPTSLEYYAYDINQQTVDLVNFYFELAGLKPLAQWRDILCEPPKIEADWALLFKMYHCLEHRQKGAGWQVVAQVPAKWVAISFPTRTLADRSTHILENYEPKIRTQAHTQGWTCELFELRTEAILLLHKPEFQGSL